MIIMLIIFYTLLSENLVEGADVCSIFPLFASFEEKKLVKKKNLLKFFDSLKFKDIEKARYPRRLRRLPRL